MDKRDCATSIVRITFRLIGPILVCVCVGLVSLIGWVHFKIISRLTFDPDSMLWLLNFIFSVWMVFNIFFNYFRVLTVPPGSPPKSLAEDVKPGQNVKICKKCNTPKPPRAHHCFICNTCILRQDHHCVWIWACVGFRNHKYFAMFLTYLDASCFYVFSLSTRLVYIGGWPKEEMSKLWLASMFSGVFALVLAGFVGFQVYLILTNQTAFELHQNSMEKAWAQQDGRVWKNQYDLGWRKNVLGFFGVNALWKIFLPSFGASVGDGLKYETNNTSKPMIRSQDTSYVYV